LANPASPQANINSNAIELDGINGGRYWTLKGAQILRFMKALNQAIARAAF
jgi:hypothetical protein